MMTYPTLEGISIRLVPLTLEHAEEFLDAADQQTFEHFLETPDWTVEGIKDLIAKRQSDGFVMAAVEIETGRLVGSSTFFDISKEHRSLEIGHTWISPSLRGTAVNPEMKYLMLRHAFDTWGMNRIQLKCDEQNLRSQAAIAKLGAVREGVLRSHMIVQGGRRRNTVFFSILKEEWPQVSEGLLKRLSRLKTV
jgi:RimJ/RimL family protein N-acetyltransferase